MATGILADLLRDFQKASTSHQKTVSDLPRIIGTIVVKNVKNNFRLSGYSNGNGVTPWKARDPKTDRAYSRRGSTYKGSVMNAGNPILMQTLNLYNSIQYKVKRGIVFIGVDLQLVPYAQAHNEGLHHEPKRQYMPLPGEPANAGMEREIMAKIAYEDEKNWKNFK